MWCDLSVSAIHHTPCKHNDKSLCTVIRDFSCVHRGNCYFSTSYPHYQLHLIKLNTFLFVFFPPDIPWGCIHFRYTLKSKRSCNADKKITKHRKYLLSVDNNTYNKNSPCYDNVTFVDRSFGVVRFQAFIFITRSFQQTAIKINTHTNTNTQSKSYTKEVWFLERNGIYEVDIWCKKNCDDSTFSNESQSCLSSPNWGECKLTSIGVNFEWTEAEKNVCICNLDQVSTTLTLLSRYILFWK